jgi:hypothetical protein
MLDDRLNRALHELIKQWNIAEHRIKKAEQVRANEVVASAIFELRYAGRKHIDATKLIIDNDLSNNQDIYEKVYAFILDATEDCVKAKHDAIDAMLNFVTSWFYEKEKIWDVSEIQQLFPKYLEVTSRISIIQERIAESRNNRTEKRDTIYDDIDENDFASILELFNTMKASQEKIDGVSKRKRLRKGSSVIFSIFLVVLGFALGKIFS